MIGTFVLNNTYVLNNSTVLTLRGGYNNFDDNYNLPYDVRRQGALQQPAASTSQLSDTNRFPTTAITGYKGTGWTNRQANGYYQYGVNGTLSKLAGSHNYKFGGDYRVIGVRSLNYGASTGHLHLHRRLQRQRGGRRAARLPAERQRAAQHGARRLRQLLRGLRAGRLARSTTSSR